MTDTPNIPRHVAIIMDGNGRWAQSRGLDRLQGHIRGVESVRNAIRACASYGVSYLTLYVFSTENNSRPAPEVEGLMDLLCRCVDEQMDELVGQGARIEVMGDTASLSPKVREQLDLVVRNTAGGKTLTVVLALNYGSRQEIARAARHLAAEAAAGMIDPSDIDPEMFSAYLYTSAYPDPDLLIRTSGECRISNFLLWQIAYSELYFTDILWPDFDEESFARALEDYGRRERRYGLTAKQIHTNDR